MSTRTSRPVPLAVTALTAFASALAALLLAGSHDAPAHGNDHQSASGTAAVTGKELALRQDMRRLWEEHVMWTRLAVISLTTDAPDTKATVARLLRNQADIGNAIKPLYGGAAGNKLTGLLRRHILIAADLIAAARQDDPAAVGDEQKRWTANADEIAALLSDANPGSWKPGPTRAMMHDHLRLTTDEVLARLQRKWGADVRAYDRIQTQILHMADMLSDGIVAQFPGRFR